MTVPTDQPEPARPSGGDSEAETLVFPAVPSSLSSRYDLLAELGRGGMGVVYRARDRETSDTVALKLIRADISGDPAAMERFRSELLLARKITHKNVCRMHELLRFAETAVISMEYVEGETLRTVLRRPQGISTRQALEWARQICAALAEAHAQEVLHRDLKPENIMFDAQGNAKVMDFGLARSLESELTRTEGISGTPAYMSPEQAEGRSLDARSDIYSLGLILYEMFTGQPAFRAETTMGLAMKQVQETPPAPRDVDVTVPRHLERVILRCLEKDPRKRFASAAAVSAALLESETEKGSPARMEEVALPPHLERWQVSDGSLVAAALAGLWLFFHFFAQSSFAPRMQVTFDRSVLVRMAEEQAGKLGVPVEGKAQTDLWVRGDEVYEYLGRRGGRTALATMGDPVDYFLWVVNLQHGDFVSTLAFNHQGQLVFFVRGGLSEIPASGRTDEASRDFAEKALQEYFGRGPEDLKEFEASSGFLRGERTFFLSGVAQDDLEGLRLRYSTHVKGDRVVYLSRWHEPPSNWRQPPLLPPQAMPLIILSLLSLVLGLLQRRKVELTARWRFACAGVVAAVMTWVVGLSMLRLEQHRPVVAPMVGIAAGLAALLLSVTWERGAQRAWPEKLTSFVRLLSGRVRSESCGLAVLRGTCTGLLLLGVNGALVAWLLAGDHVWLPKANILWGALLLRQLTPSLHTVPTGVFAALLTGGALTMLAAPLSRWLRRPWIGALVAAALTGLIFGVITEQPLIHLGSVRPHTWAMILMAAQLVVLGLVLLRYDILTVVVAVFTFEFWWQNYTLMTILEKVGATEQWIAFAAWGLMVAGAAAVVWQRQLKRAYVRLAELGA